VRQIQWALASVFFVLGLLDAVGNVAMLGLCLLGWKAAGPANAD